MPDTDDKHIEKLVKMLQSPKSGTRYEACEYLRVAPTITPEAIIALQNALNDTDMEVADAAQRALTIHTQQANPDKSVEKKVDKLAITTVAIPKWLDNIVGTVMLLIGIGLSWVWHIITPENYRSEEIGFYIIGLIACGFIVLTSIALIIWIRNKKIKVLSNVLRVSAIVVPFVLSFFGCGGGVEWGFRVSKNDYPLGEAFLGIIIGFGMGALFSLYIFVITSKSNTQT